MSLLNQSFQLLGDMGFFDVVLPFLLFFSIAYGVLTKSKIFENNQLNTIIAVVMGLLATASVSTVAFTQEFLPIVSLLLLFGLSLLLFSGLFGGDNQDNFVKYISYIGILAGVIGVIFFVFQYYIPLSNFQGMNANISEDYLAQIISAVIIASVIIFTVWYISKK